MTLLSFSVIIMHIKYSETVAIQYCNELNYFASIAKNITKKCAVSISIYYFI